jgi:hypothetical protein
MILGTALRGSLVPPNPVARWYRKWHVDLDISGRRLSRFRLVTRVAEVGCGEAHLTERLAAESPKPPSSASMSPIDRPPLQGSDRGVSPSSR